MASCNAFDGTTEPRRASPRPLFMRLARVRRGRSAILVSALCALTLLVLWKGSGKISPQQAFLRYKTTPTSPHSYISKFVDGSETPLMPQSDPDQLAVDGVIKGLMKTSPSFHLLVPASQANPNLCKTLLSSFVLGYPSPTLINYQKVLDEVDWANGTHTGKIRGVYDFLVDKKVNDDDLVMIIDGFDVWFQLPPKLLIERYHVLLDEANKRLRGRYGMVIGDKLGEDGEIDMVPKYEQKVLFAADKECWPNHPTDPACVAVPYSTLPKNVYGSDTDKDPNSFRNRPRWLNSGTIFGPVAHVRAIYKAALDKVDEGRGVFGDQFVFSEIFGEQEYQREVQRKYSQGTGSRWLDWLSDALGTSESPLSANVTINNSTIKMEQNLEFGIGLDYAAYLFQTMTHSAADVEFITYNDTALLAHSQDDWPSRVSRSFSLPIDIERAEPPYSYASPGDHSNDPKDATNLLPTSPRLDDIDHEPSFYEVPLATNIYASSVPGLLHFNGDKSLLNSWWHSMWFSSDSRALLRRYVRSALGPNAARAAAAGGLNWWDTRGGRGGVWTDRGTWMSWGEICKNTEDEVFGDGKGVWGREEGSSKVVNSFGRVMSGDDDDDDDNDDAEDDQKGQDG